VNVDVLFFAAARERAGTDRLRVEVPEPATIARLWERLAALRPALRDVLPACRAAVDEEFAPRSTPLREGSVVAVLPPVSGG
jgi:molybdopterin converting factor subunit 1